MFSNSKPLQTPKELRSVNGILDISLTVQVAVVTNELFSFQTRLFCVDSDCSFPGPSLYVSPGDFVSIRLTNLLQSGHQCNRTNLFFYGLPIDPTLNSPYRFTSGDGDSLLYEFEVPTDTPPGSTWCQYNYNNNNNIIIKRYHSRVAGNSAMHTMGGLHVSIKNVVVFKNKFYCYDYYYYDYYHYFY